jgi:hypothetical protein
MNCQDCRYYDYFIYLLKLQNNEINQLQQQLTDNENLSVQYSRYTNIINTWQLINLTYQNIVRNPFPITKEDVRSAVFNPTLYQTSLDLLSSTGYTYPVYMYVIQLNLEDSNQSIFVYHPNPALGVPPYLTALQADANLGNQLTTTTVRTFVNTVKTRPLSYQVFYVEYPWISGLKRAYIMTYLPKPNFPYNNNSSSPDYNPFYVVGSGIL